MTIVERIDSLYREHKTRNPFLSQGGAGISIVVQSDRSGSQSHHLLELPQGAD